MIRDRSNEKRRHVTFDFVPYAKHRLSRRVLFTIRRHADDDDDACVQRPPAATSVGSRNYVSLIGSLSVALSKPTTLIHSSIPGRAGNLPITNDDESVNNRRHATIVSFYTRVTRGLGPTLSAHCVNQYDFRLRSSHRRLLFSISPRFLRFCTTDSLRSEFPVWSKSRKGAASGYRWNYRLIDR